MEESLVQPNGWVGLKLPSESVRFLQVVPNTTVSLGKYGSFPSNLIIHRPFDLTYELQDKLEGENYSRLRIIPPSELHAEILADEAAAAAAASKDSNSATPDDAETILATPDGIEYSLIDLESQAVIARSNRESIDNNARQTLTSDEIEALKQEGGGAGKDLIAKLMLSHAALDQKTTFSLAKYKLLKTKKYIRRFTVLPLDVFTLGNWLIDDKDAGSKILDLRDEMVALLGCWANVHYGGADRHIPATKQIKDEDMAGNGANRAVDGGDEKEPERKTDLPMQLQGGRWLAVDDTGGLLVAALAERMGVLNAQTPPWEESEKPKNNEEEVVQNDNEVEMKDSGAAPVTECDAQAIQSADQRRKQILIRPSRKDHQPWRDNHNDFFVPFSLTNTLTVLHTNSQANLSYLKYFGYDCTDPNPPPHPLAEHLLCLSWLQLIEPESDTVYALPPPEETPEVIASWKPTRRGNYHRKRRRWARTRHIVDTTRAGGFSGLVVATAMDLISTLRHTLPLLAGGAPVAIYSPTLEPLTALADCFSVARRTAWSGAEPPPEIAGQSVEEQEQWSGSDAFPLNPMMLLGVTVQTSRVRKWQVLPGRTHPLMTARGGSEGYVFTGWKAKPAEGRVTARGKFKRR